MPHIRHKLPGCERRQLDVAVVEESHHPIDGGTRHALGVQHVARHPTIADGVGYAQHVLASERRLQQVSHARGRPLASVEGRHSLSPTVTRPGSVASRQASHADAPTEPTTNKEASRSARAARIAATKERAVVGKTFARYDVRQKEGTTFARRKKEGYQWYYQ